MKKLLLMIVCIASFSGLTAKNPIIAPSSRKSATALHVEKIELKEDINFAKEEIQRLVRKIAQEKRRLSRNQALSQEYIDRVINDFESELSNQKTELRQLTNRLQAIETELQ